MRMGIGLGVGINRSNYAQGIFNAYSARVVADGGVVEGGSCVDAVSSLLQSASLLLIPSGYKGGKLYAEIPTNGNGDLTWTRTSTANRTNSSGNIELMATGVPRLSYMYGSCPSVLLEPQRTNLLVNSGMTGGGATPTGYASFITGSTTAVTSIKNNSVTAYRFSGTSQRAFFVQSLSTTIGSTYSFSVYCESVTTAQAIQDTISGGVIVSYYKNGVAIAGTTNIEAGNFYSIVLTASVISTDIRFGIGVGGNITANIVLSMPQFEQGAYATTFILSPVSATATRVADSASKTGISSLIGQTEGTIFVDFIVSGIGANNINIYNNDRAPSTISTNAIVFKPNGSIDCQTFLGNGTFASITISASTYSVGQRIKLAYRYKSGDFAVYINGIQKATATNTLTFVGTKSQIYLDDNAVIYGYQEAVHYNQFALFTTALTNAELTQLTT